MIESLDNHSGGAVTHDEAIAGAVEGPACGLRLVIARRERAGGAEAGQRTAGDPGLGAAGLYYYYQTMSKALSIAKIDYIKTKDGKLIDWRKDITEKLLSLQKGDGSWSNTEGRWMESDPVLTTSYILMALGRIHQTL